MIWTIVWLVGAAVMAFVVGALLPGYRRDTGEEIGDGTVLLMSVFWPLTVVASILIFACEVGRELRSKP